MKQLSHKSAKSSHYNQEAETYDSFNEKNSVVINGTLEKVLKKHKVKTILDMTCGTGSQVFWLGKKGFEVVGSDINRKMLKIAKDKSKKEKLNLQFYLGDMRTSQFGKFDAVITIFNAVGHLTKSDFEVAIKNIWNNLNTGGLYIFDINNLDFLLNENNITKLTIDWQVKQKNSKSRVIQYSTIEENGILASYTTSIDQKGSKAPKVTKQTQTLQIYSSKQLKEMLLKNRFRVIEQCDVDGSIFNNYKTERILTIAKKV